MEDVNDSIIIQLFKKDKLVRSRSVTTSGSYTFDFVDPDTYHMKLVHDRNGNGKWDTGKYLKGIQPEEVEFIPRELKIRANGDHDVTYVIGSNKRPPVAAEAEETAKPLF